MPTPAAHGQTFKQAQTADYFPKGQMRFAFDITMPSAAVKKPTSVVQVAMGELGLLHRKILNALIANATPNLTDGKSQFEVRTKDLATACGFQSHDYAMLYDHCASLMVTKVGFVDFDAKSIKSKVSKHRRVGGTTLLSAFAIIEDGHLRYAFSAELVTILRDPSSYIWMLLDQQKQLTSKYELALYENCLRFAKVGSTGFKPIEDWRALLGATSATYDDFKRFNAAVLKPATKGVNAKTNLNIQPEVKREHRRVTAVRFDVAASKTGDLSEGQTSMPPNSKTPIQSKPPVSDEPNVAIIEECVAVGISQSMAEAWVQSKGLDAVEDALLYTKNQSPKNPAAYLARAVEQEFGTRSPLQRAQDERKAQGAQKERETAERLNALLPMALSYLEIKRRFDNAVTGHDVEMLLALENHKDVAQLQNAFNAMISSSPAAARQFDSQGWSARLCRSKVRAFAAETIGWQSLEEAGFFERQGADWDQLYKAYQAIDDSPLSDQLRSQAAISI